MTSLPVFSQKELTFLQDKEFLLTKTQINHKVFEILGCVEKRLHPSVVMRQFPKTVLTRSGKISKGDNYQGLPYFVLDYPRKFGREGIFAFRTMLWWGHFWSTTLHISGTFLNRRRAVLIDNVDKIIASNVYLCVHTDPWEYHYEEDNYLPAKQILRPQLISLLQEKPFVKISFKWPLEEFSSLPHLAQKAFDEFMIWTEVDRT